MTVEAEPAWVASVSLGAVCVDFIFSQFLFLPALIHGELVIALLHIVTSLNDVNTETMTQTGQSWKEL